MRRISRRCRSSDQKRPCNRWFAPVTMLSLPGEYARVGAPRGRAQAAGPADSGTERMATVRQSITALYEESQKSALEGAPMLAVLQSEAVAQEPHPAVMTDLEAEEVAQTPAIALRFDELRRLADIEAGSDTGRQAAPTDDGADPLVAIDPAAGYDAAPEDVLADIPIIEIPVSPFGTGSGTASSPDAMPEDDMPEDDGQDDLTDEMEPLSAQAALPDEPPAPAAGESLGDLDIGDIQDLVRQAWEDETAIGDAARAAKPLSAPDADEPAPDIQAQPYDPALSGGIEMAMEEIAAAVVQSADTASTVDVETIKTDIIEAMRAELQAVVDSDIRSIVKAAVAEAIAEMPAATTTAKKAPAKKTATKKAAAKKTASGKNTKKAETKAATPEESDDS